MQLYIRVKIHMKEPDSVTTQLAAVNVKNPEHLSDENAADILERVTQTIVANCGEGAEAIDSEFIPSSAFDLHFKKDGKDYVWRTLYFKAVVLSTRNDEIHFDTKALYSVNINQSPLLFPKEEKRKIKRALVSSFCLTFGVSPYDIQEISPSEFKIELEKRSNQ